MMRKRESVTEKKRESEWVGTRYKLGKSGRLAAVQSLILIQSPVTVQLLILYHLWAKQIDKDTETNHCSEASVFKHRRSNHMLILLFGRSESQELRREFAANCSHKAVGEYIIRSFFLSVGSGQIYLVQKCKDSFIK